MRKISLLLTTLLFLFCMNANAEQVFSGEHEVGSWNALQLPVADYPVLAKANAGDVIAITVTAVESGARVTLQDISWSGFADEYNCEAGVHYFVLTEASAAKLNEGGLIVTGEKYTFNKVELLYRKALWEGTVDDNSGWGQSDALGNDLFAELTAGSLLGVDVTAINDGASWHQMAIRVDYSDNMITGSTSEAKTLLYELTDEQVTTLQTKTINVIAQYLKVSAIYTYIEEKTADSPVVWEGETVWEGSQATGSWENYVNLSYDNRGELANARMTDIIRVTLTTTDEDAQVQLSNPANGWAAFSDAAFSNLNYSIEPQTFSYAIASASVLEDIQQTGIIVAGKNITISRVELVKTAGRYNAASVTIGAEGIISYSSSKSLDFSGTGLTPYYASEATTGTVTMTSVATTWGYQGYLIKGAAGTYDVPVTENAEYPSPNYLKATSDYSATVDASTDGAYHYIFAKKNDNSEYGFYKLTSNTTLAAHKAYLETSTDIVPVGGTRLSISFDGVVTGIYEIANGEISDEPNSRTVPMTHSPLYDLQGRRVSSPQKGGIYIKNNRKYIIK